MMGGCIGRRAFLSMCGREKLKEKGKRMDELELGVCLWGDKNEE